MSWPTVMGLYMAVAFLLSEAGDITLATWASKSNTLSAVWRRRQGGGWAGRQGQEREGRTADHGELLLGDRVT